MKVLHALLIVLLVALSKAESCSSSTEPGQASDCHNREKGTDVAKCCFADVKYFLKGD